MKTFHLFLLPLFCLLTQTAEAQFKRFYARKDNYANGTRIVNLPNNEKLLLNNFQNGPGGDTLQLIRLGATGNLVWAKHVSFQSTGVNDVTLAPNGDLILVGGSRNQIGAIASQPKAIYMRISPDGELVDSIRGYGTSSVSTFNSAVVLNNHGYIAAEYADFNNFAATFSYYFLLLKTDLNGKIVWVKRYSLPSASVSPIAPQIVATSDGGLVIAFSHIIAAIGGNPPVSRLYFIKTNADGNVSWTKSANVSAIGRFMLPEMVKLNNDDIALLCRIEKSFLSPLVDFAIIKFNESGNFIEARKFGAGQNTEIPFAMKRMPDGNLALAGRRIDRTVSPLEFGEFIAKISPQLNLTSARWYKFQSYNLFGAGMEVDNDGTIHYATSYYCQPQNKYFQALIKAQPSDMQAGCQDLESSISLPDSAMNLTFANENYTLTDWFGRTGAVASGTISVPLAALDICEGCPEEINNVSEKLNPGSLQLYPNPVDDFVEVATEFPLHIKILDVHGNEKLSNTLAIGKTNLNLQTLKPGLYLMLASGAKGSLVKKIVKK